MTPELGAGIVAFIGVMTTLATAVVKLVNAKTKALEVSVSEKTHAIEVARAETKKVRDDEITKIKFDVDRLKDDIALQKTINDENRKQFEVWNTTLVEIRTLVNLLVDDKIKTTSQN